MVDMTPHAPQHYTLSWPDDVLTLQDVVRDLASDTPLYIVGGAVRDAMLRRPVKDIDLATSGDAISIGRRIANHFQGDFFVMDAERSVGRVLLKLENAPMTIDIAKFRGDDLLADLQGRDFTVNALAVDLHGDLALVIDPLNGEADAMQKTMRRVAPGSIAEDPIRSLRAIRQSVQLSYKIEPETRRDMRAHAPALADTSPERVRDEFFSMLALPLATRALRVADVLGLLKQILPRVDTLHDLELPPPHLFEGWKHTIETADVLNRILTAISYQRTDSTAANFDIGMLAIQLDRFRQALNIHIGQQWPNDRTQRALLLLASLLHATGRVAQADDVGGISAGYAAQVADDLRLSNPEKKRLIGMIANYYTAQTLDYQSALALHRYWYTLGEVGIDALLLSLANYHAVYGNELAQDAWLEQVERAVVMLDAYYNRRDTIVSPQPLLNGKELMDEFALGSGPVVGDLLTAIREAQVTGAVSNRQDALALCRQLLA